MKAIHINSYVTEKDPRHPVKCYVYRPDDPAADAWLEEVGWRRRNLLEGDYFYWTEHDGIAELTAMHWGLDIDQPQFAPIWRINYHPPEKAKDKHENESKTRDASDRIHRRRDDQNPDL
jgi:hypothetical protein